jgi:hypothetical protein
MKLIIISITILLFQATTTTNDIYLACCATMNDISMPTHVQYYYPTENNDSTLLNADSIQK